LVALVGSGIKDNIVNQTVLIFKGGQGLGKSTFIQGLIPKELKNYFYNGNLNPDSKDSVIQLSESILCNLDELDSLSKYKESALKEMITKADIRIRRPYARYATKMVRHASLCGSVNHSAILHDPSGSRRYLIHTVKSINYQHSIPMDKVYVQALHLFNNGFKYWFDGEDIELVNTQNRKYEVQTIEEELLLKHFKKASKNEQLAQKLRATELLTEIYRDKLPANAHSAKIRIGVALSKNKFEYTEANGSKYWWIVRKHFPIDLD
jgi:predicted P-loop ATPase